MGRFAGFPSGSLPAVPLPQLFFTELLPQIDTLAELKVTLHVLWRTGANARCPAFLTSEDVAHDERLLASLRGEPGGAAHAVARGLDAAVARGTLLRSAVAYRDAQRELVAPNTARGRQALAALRASAATLDAPPVAPPPPERPAERPAIFALYEANVGLVQPLIAEELGQAAELYPAAWIEDAFAQAVAYNRRSWRYVKRILERWATEGRQSDATARERTAVPAPAAPKRRWHQTYRRGEPLPDL